MECTCFENDSQVTSTLLCMLQQIQGVASTRASQLLIRHYRVTHAIVDSCKQAVDSPVIARRTPDTNDKLRLQDP